MVHARYGYQAKLVTTRSLKSIRKSVQAALTGDLHMTLIGVDIIGFESL